MYKRIRVVLTLLLSVASAAGAQEISGALEGRVLAPDGDPLAEVEVTATSPHLLGTHTVVTDQSGRFRFPALPVGTYRLEARRVGLRPVTVEGVPVRLGATSNLPHIVLELRPAVQLAEVVVSAEAVGLDPASTADRTTLDIDNLDALPVERNFREIVQLAPQASPSFLGDGINVAGATGFENAYYVDGINITSPINGSTSLDLPYNFIQQIEVRTAGATAEDAQALGGVVNVVTPSGGNQFHGSAFGFWSGDAAQTATRPVAGATQTGFAFYDAALSLSGPVLRDRLWFFAAYDRNYERRDHTYAFGQLPDIRRQDLFAGKLSWRVGPLTAATFTVLADPSRIEPVGIPPLSTGVPQNREVLEATGKTGGHGVSLRLRHTTASTVMLEASASQMTRLESNEPATAAGRQPVFSDAVAGTVSGGRGVAVRFESRRRSANVSATWQLGDHTLKSGVAYQELLNVMTFAASRSTFGGDLHRTSATAYSWHYYEAPNGRGKIRNPAVYAQDVWRITPRIAVSGGVRWSQQDMVNAAADSFVFRIHDGLQPRVGVVFQLSGSGEQRVFASYGRVVEQLAPFNASEYAAGAESLMTFPQDPRSDTTGGVLVYAIPTGAGTPGDANIRGETSDEWTLGYDRRLGSFLALSTRLVRRSLRDAVAHGRLIWGNLGGGRLSDFPRPSRRYDALEISLERREAGSTWYQVSYVLSRTRGNYPGVYISDWRFPGPTANFGPLYLFPSEHVDGFGLLPNDRTHIAKVFASHRFGPGFAIGGSFVVASGTPLSEYGAIPEAPPPLRGFASPRGTAGRTPTIWDLGIRAVYELPLARASNVRSRVLLDLEHVGSPRTPVDYEQLHYTCLDANGNQSCPNPNYGAVVLYQPPMTARLGVALEF